MQYNSFNKPVYQNRLNKSSEYIRLIEVIDAYDSAKQTARDKYKVSLLLKSYRLYRKGWSQQRIDYYMQNAKRRIDYKSLIPYINDMFCTIDICVQREIISKTQDVFNDFVNIKDVKMGVRC